MIGPSEREIRYETLVQRLLRRRTRPNAASSASRRSCRSGDQLDDLTAWIRADEPGEPVRSDWRPTRQRFGTLTWRGKARLIRLDLDDDGPFLDRFVVQKAASGRRKSPIRARPRISRCSRHGSSRPGQADADLLDPGELGRGLWQTVVDLCKRGYLHSLLDDEASIARALEVGNEWLGEDHPAVACLKVGVAIHHGRLPTRSFVSWKSFCPRRGAEGDRRIADAFAGAQPQCRGFAGPSSVSGAETITGEEFANVAGRAGRAFVDVEGLIVHVMFDQDRLAKREWQSWSPPQKPAR